MMSVVPAVVKKAPVADTTPAPAKPKFPPYSIAAAISVYSNPVGSGQTFQKNVEIDGKADPYSTVWLAEGFHPGYFTNITKADYQGNFSFLVPVGQGTTTMQIFAENLALDYSKILDVPVTRASEVVAWDSIALRAISTAALSAPEAARDLAILHAAEYDAVAAVDFPNAAYQVPITAPKGTSAEIAVDAVSEKVLAALFPSQSYTFYSAYVASTYGLPKTKSLQDGITLGNAVAAQTVADRANDGSQVSLTLPISNVPGQWRPTPPSFFPSRSTQFGQVKPFEIASPSSFRPSAPPALGSAAYDQALAQVASLGRANSTTRTPDQTKAAQFWADNPGSFTDPGHWNSIAEQISESRNDSLATDARLFAQLDFALADTAIATTDAQNTYDEWRPISAVQQTDPTFTSLLTTPPTPSYTSGGAAYGAAASTVLTAAFGPNVKFTDDIYAVAGVTRTFSSFAAAALEDANSQIWGGVNFSFDTAAGATLGTQVGQAVLSNFPKGK